MSVSFLENFIPESLADQLQKEICDPEFNWYWMASTKYGNTNPEHESEDFQFAHTMVLDNKIFSNTFFTVRELLFAFEKATGITIKNIFKIKANLLPRQTISEAGLHDAIHVDLLKTEKNYLTIVYYVEDSDGNTVVYDDQYRVIAEKAPIKGTAIYFPSDMLHRATPPTNNKKRIVINIVVEI